MYSVNRTEVDPDVLILKSFIIRLKSVCLFFFLFPNFIFCGIKVVTSFILSQSGIKSVIYHKISNILYELILWMENKLGPVV